MAWIEQRPPKPAPPKFYLVRWTEPGGKTVSSKRRTFTEARAFKAEMESAIAKGHYVAQEIRKMPFGAYAKLVLDSDRGLARSTRLNYDTCLGLQLKSLAYIPIESVDPGVVRALFSRLGAEGASDHTLQMTRKTLSKVCSAAMEDGILTRNPARSVRLSKPARRQVRPLTPEEVENVSESLPGRWKAAVLLAAWGGLRISEVGALTREDIDWERGTVRINKSVGRFGVKEAKTAASNRTVTLPAWVMQELRRHVLKYAAPDGRLFLTEHGNPIFNDPMGHLMAKYVPGVRFHDLRHTHATLLIKMGANPREIMERMGHGSIKITFDTYGWLFPGADDTLAQRLEQYQPSTSSDVVELGGR